MGFLKRLKKVLDLTSGFLHHPALTSCRFCVGQMADVHKVYLGSLFLAYVFQFQNAALLSSPLLSLLIGSVLARYFQVALALLPDVTCYCFNLITINRGSYLFQQKMKVGPLVARVMKLCLHFHLVFTTGITFSYLVKVRSHTGLFWHICRVGYEAVISVFHRQKLTPVSDGDFILKFLEVKFGLNTTT